MTDFFDKFILSFCKVEFLCYSGDPNWLGWIFLVCLGIFLVWLLLAFIALVLSN